MIPKISVIVPIYNVEWFLDRCVQSLCNQTLSDIEIILVDDESPDNCPQMCEKYKAQDSRIKVVHKKNGGLGYARNSGMKVATGEYIAFVDSDDYVDLDMFEVMYKVALEHNADFVRVDNYKEHMDGTIVNQDYIPPMREGVYNCDELREHLLYPQLGKLPEEDGSKYVSCSVWRNIYRREIIERLGLEFVSERNLISEDIPFNLQFMMNANCAYVVNKKLYHYIVNDKSLTQTYRSDRFEKEIKLYHELVKQTQELGIYEVCKIRLYRHLLTRARMCVKSEFISNVSKSLLRKSVSNILQCKEMKIIYSCYPDKNLPIKYRIVYLMMKYNCFCALYIIRNKI